MGWDLQLPISPSRPVGLALPPEMPPPVLDPRPEDMAAKGLSCEALGLLIRPAIKRTSQSDCRHQRTMLQFRLCVPNPTVALFIVSTTIKGCKRAPCNWGTAKTCVSRLMCRHL